MKSVLVCLIFFLVLFTTTGDCVVINRTETEEPHTVRSCTAPLQCVEKYCNDACKGFFSAEASGTCIDVDHCSCSFPCAR
ncbi:hypothetical protein CDL15_Pgr028905 [Punica granatum]|uniref:Uncharacterized protein n=1 Tax=Punica granatum TaxID=22663 RepID=A0A218WXG9_PUNGR|nr:hypothetical protein CDL15_Pgr028905 [Punica granatum]